MFSLLGMFVLELGCFIADRILLKKLFLKYHLGTCLNNYCRSGKNKDREEIPEPGPPARPPIPQRIIVVPDPAAPPRR